MVIYPNKFMADVLFVKWLKTFVILTRLHKQNQEINTRCPNSYTVALKP